LKKEKSVPVEICGGVLSDDELVKMYNRSKINLGFSVVGETFKTPTPIQQIRLRDFEVTMSGGFYLLEYFSEIESFFRVGEEIACFSSKDELLEKIRYYLSHPEEREAIRLAGLRRAQNDQTWQKRFSTLFEAIEQDRE
jgi:spore maturation protein CgeB